MTEPKPGSEEGIKLFNERERYIRLDEAVSDSGVGGMYIVGVKTFAEMMANLSADEAEAQLLDWIGWAQTQLGTDPAQGGQLMIPLIALVPDAMADGISPSGEEGDLTSDEPG